jgi:hypothetical protein
MNGVSKVILAVGLLSFIVHFTPVIFTWEVNYDHDFSTLRCSKPFLNCFQNCSKL